MRITDSKGSTIVDNSGSDLEVYDKNAARMVSSMLQYGVEHGIAMGAKLDDAVVAVKTGTTTDNKDGWTVGYSAYYTTAVWVGCDIPKVVPNLTGGSYPMTIWKGFMQKIHEELELKEFPEYTRYDNNNSGLDKLPDDIIDNTGKDNEQESTAALEDIQNALGDKSYNGSGGDGEASASNGGDSNVSGSITGDASVAAPNNGDGTAPGTVSGDENISGYPGGDSNAAGTVGGDRNASSVGGDKNASGLIGGDKGAGTVGGDRNATGLIGGDKGAGTIGGDKNASTTAGGDKNAGSFGGDTSTGASQKGDTNAGNVTGGDSDVVLP